jgi:hypothetical protein
MVNANGYPTRTRDRNVPFVQSTSGTFKLHGSHRFLKLAGNMDTMQRDQFVQSISKRVDKLSPATRRVLAAVRAAMFISYDPVKGYVFRQYVNRVEIAKVLKRSSLVPYDIRMLRQLCDLRLIEECKHPLPRKQYGEIWLGAGAEFVYTIHSDVLYCLLHHDPRERSRLLALKSARGSAARPYQPLSQRELDTLLDRASKAQKRGLLARLVEWFTG